MKITITSNSNLIRFVNVQLDMNINNVLFNTRENSIVDLDVKDKNIVFEYLNEDCGRKEIIINSLKIYDPFNLTCKNKKVSIQKNYFVYPELLDLEYQINNELFQNDSGENYSPNKKGNDHSEMFDLKDYQKGDSIKSIHWKLSSKLERLIVREFGHPSSFHTAILFDGVLDKEIKYVNSIFSLVNSISNAFMVGNLNHYVGYFDSEIKLTGVENKGDFNDMIDTVLSLPLLNEPNKILDSFIVNEEFKAINDVIYVTNNLHEDVMRVLSDYCFVTIIVIGDRSYEESYLKYKIISLDVDTLREKPISLFI